MENEKRLIDALPFMKAGWHLVRTGKSNEYLASLSLADVPTVDAVEVVHGRWEDEHGGKYVNPRYRCSVCKQRALYKFERDLLDNWKEVQALTPNCPYCMAKLDGGKEV